MNWEEIEIAAPTGLRRVRCVHCGYVLPPIPSTIPLAQIGGMCPGCQIKSLAAASGLGDRVATAARPPRLLRKLANFSLAAISHAMSGAPTCTQEQIDERYTICRACEIYQPDKDNPEVGVCTHRDCGCPITRAGKFVSKLAWASQDCPLGKWPELGE